MEEDALLCVSPPLSIISRRLPPALRYTCTQQQQRWVYIWTAVLCQQTAVAHHQDAQIISFPPPLPPPPPPPLLCGLVTVAGQSSSKNDEQGLGKAQWIT